MGTQVQFCIVTV